MTISQTQPSKWNKTRWTIIYNWKVFYFQLNLNLSTLFRFPIWGFMALDYFTHSCQANLVYGLTCVPGLTEVQSPDHLQA